MPPNGALIKGGTSMDLLSAQILYGTTGMHVERGFIRGGHRRGYQWTVSLVSLVEFQRGHSRILASTNPSPVFRRLRTDMRLLSGVFETPASASSANPPTSLLDHTKG
jgi:hypothetical protein